MASGGFGIQTGRHTSPTLLDYAVGANGIFGLTMAGFALTKPLLMLRLFDIRATSPEAKKVARNMFVVFAARDIALGLGITSAAYYGHREIMGWSIMGVAVIGLFDGLVNRSNAKGGERKHFLLIGTSLALAGACFGYI